MFRIASTAAAVVVLLRTVAAAESCDMPSGFSVSEWQSWEPSDELDDSGFVMFTVTDEDTNLFTPCYMDAYTPPIDEEAEVMSYLCDNPIAQFTYVKGMLSVSENLCIDETGAGLFRVTGKLSPDVECEDASDQGGEGMICYSMEPTKSTFTSFEPIGIDFPMGPITTIGPGGPRH